MSRLESMDADPSLFPFMSVLVGVIGTLILLMAGMATLALGDVDQIIEGSPIGEKQKEPTYVECRRTGVLIHPERVSVPADQLSQNDNEWDQLLRAIKNDCKSRYIIFLIRPDGIKTFEKARPIVSRLELDVGYEPVYGTGEIYVRNSRAGGIP